MDSTLYKDFSTSRGFKYHYYYSPPPPSGDADKPKPFIVFIHGFPSTSNDWRNQVPYFKSKGYGLIVPDMLGYGGTSKPTESVNYKHSLLAKDVIEILDEEGVKEAVFIGHDWGSRITSRIVQLYPTRVIAAGFLAVGYGPPAPTFDYEAMLKMTKEKVGYELLGYWKFFSEEGCAKFCEDNIDRFMNILYADDPKIWITDMAPSGALKAALLSKKEFKPASWLSEEERKQHAEELLKGGLAAPVCYYKVQMEGHAVEDDKTIPVENYTTTKPVFIGAALEDYVALAALTKAAAVQLCKNVTVRDFKTGHWVMIQAKDEVNKELGGWLDGIGT